MRKWIALILVFALCLCAPAWAESVTDALGITGGEEGAVRGDLSARTDTDLYVVKMCIRDRFFFHDARMAAAEQRRAEQPGFLVVKQHHGHAGALLFGQARKQRQKRGHGKEQRALPAAHAALEKAFDQRRGEQGDKRGQQKDVETVVNLSLIHIS